MLSCVLVFVAIMLTTYTKKTSITSANTRTIELNNVSVDNSSIFEKFDSYDIEVTDNTSKFEGYATLTISDYDDADYVSSTDIAEEATLKFTTSFNYDTGTTTLNVLSVSGEEITLIDTIYGVALLADTGEVDIVFDFDGELIFLSELNNTETLDNVGWFTNLIKKAVKSVVSTVETTVKVLSTSKGAIGTVCTLAACAIVGAACAFIPGGQIVTTTCASIAGAVVGSVGFNLTAKAAQTQNSSITDEDISTYTTLGGIVGSSVSVYTCNSVTAWKASVSKVKKYQTFNDFKKENGIANDSPVKYGNTGDKGTYEWHHIVEQNQISNSGFDPTQIYNTENTISLGYKTHRDISGIYSSKIGNLANKGVNGLPDLFKGASSNLTVRQYMSTLNYSQQMMLGKEILKLFGVIL
jgi:hypothetical protein